MFGIGEKILYGSVGVCEIKEICGKAFGGKLTDYYVLVPVYKEHSTVYVPVDSEPLCEKMRKLHTKDELDEILGNLYDEEILWDDNKYTRRESFTAVLEKGSLKSLFALCRMLDNHNKELMEKGKKLHIFDERIFGDAEKLIGEELSVVLDIPKENVKQYLVGRIKETV